MSKIREYMQLVKKLIVLVSPLKLFMILAILFGSIGHIIATLIPVIGGYALIKAMIGKFYFFKLITILVIFALLRSVLRYLEQLCNHFVAFRVLEIIRDRVFKALRRLAPAKMENTNTGELITIITSDIELLEVFYAHTISPISIAFIHTLFLTILMFKINVLYAVVLVIFHLIMAIIVPIITSNRAKSIGDIQRKNLSDINSSIIDTFYGIEESAQYQFGGERRSEMLEYTKKLSRSATRLSRIYGGNMALSNSVILIGNICILISAMYLYKFGYVNKIEVVVPIIAFMSSFGPVSALSNLANNLVTTFACGKRVMSLLEEVPEVEEVVNGKDINFEEIDVSKVSFSYGSEEVLKDFDLAVKKGEILGLKGKSGCGKSTLLKLIMRFYDVDSGKIEENKINIKEINTKTLRKNHCYITQSTHLFNGTILDNLKIAKEDATMEEIKVACRKASIGEFIEELPNGYNTKVGDIENSLSTGEKQRISVARGFIQNGDLLLLDEPTANIDSLNEGIILKSIWEESKDKAVILASHKDSTLRISDRIKQVKTLAE